ncbi:hypothetical protein CLG96_06320 [Sphingomonas oleivorans]|uniref:TonB-dependent receptor n=1 Tax=Sphingomonas oleivorans TaxID=1735121 RepID=A0A2T5FZT5_9SPHN|nr:TonB-dependent receptor [Sphingomonas oleivorans]PTQ12167.1 hypothetical protein CLG96_06320 [Sphingomonas oleivorans]
MKMPVKLAIFAAGCSFGTLATAQTAAPPTAPREGATPQDERAASRADQAAPASDPASDEPQPDEIIVTGVRASLQRAAELKRNAGVVSDSISAEDIGKFPDANIADALQRVTGVQIARNTGGEGRFVAIRGLGSQFNLTTFNGRVITTDGAGRDFSYDILPAEVLASATVYKSPSASLTDGSIGGLVELTTINPLARPGFHFSGNVGGLYDESTDKLTPRFGGAVSNSFADNSLGVFAGVYYYKRQWRSDTFESFARSTEVLQADGSGCRTPTEFCGPGIGRAAFPGIMSYQVKNGPRKRWSLVGGVEWQPADSFRTKIDAFYSYYDTPEQAANYIVNFFANEAWARYENATYEDWPGPGQNKYFLTKFDVTNIPVEFGTDVKSRKVKTYQFGWNTAWDAFDDFTVKLDLAVSRSSRPNRGEDYYTVSGVTGGNYSFEATGRAPNVTCTLPDGRSCYSITNDEIALNLMEQKGELVKDDAFSSRLDFSYAPGSLGDLAVSIDYGGFYSSRKKRKEIYDSPNENAHGGFTTTLGSVGVVAVIPFPNGDGYRSGIVGIDNKWPAIDALRIFEAAIRANGQAYFDANTRATLVPRASSIVKEDQYGGYVQLNLKSNAIDANIGVRYVETNVDVTGSEQQLLSLTPIGNNNFEPVFSPIQPVTGGNVYGNWLPSANVTWRIRDNLQLRAAASKAITRPTLSQLGLDVNYEVRSNPPLIGQNGDPKLRAIKSDSLDLSLEWYGGQGSSASLAGFYKSIDGFVAAGIFNTMIAGFPGTVIRPINGDTAELIGAEVAMQHVLPSGFGATANYTFADTRSRLTLLDGTEVERDLDGVSRHTFNLSGFYEKGAISARLSYAYRGKFVDCAICGPVNTTTTTAATGFVDFSASYKINRFISIYLDLSNLTEEDFHRYASDKRFAVFYERYARRAEFGVRGSF